jgi:Right handed beta helix region
VIKYGADFNLITSNGDRLSEDFAAIIANAEGLFVPPGGLAGQVLTKISDNDFDDDWADLPTPPIGDMRAENNLSDLDNLSIARQTLSSPVYVTNRIAMHSMSDPVVILTEKGREGIFIRRDDAAPNDPLEGIWVGQYERLYNGPINVCWFGAKSDGVTPCREAFQAAHDFLPPEFGGAIYIPPSKQGYVIEGTINISTNSISYFGDLKNNSKIVINNHNFDLFNVISTHYFYLRDIKIRGSGTPIANKYIVNSTTTRGCILDNINAGGVISSYCRLPCAETQICNFTVKGLMPSYGIFLNLDTGYPALSEVCQVYNGIVFNDAGKNCFAGIYITGGGPLEMTNVEMAKMGTPIFANVPDGHQLASIVLNNVWCDTSSGSGMYLRTAGSGVIKRVRAINSWFSSSGEYGVRISGQVWGLTLSDSEIFDNGQDGVVIEAGSSLNGCIITSNKIGGNRGNGVNIGAWVNDFQVGLNRIGPVAEFGGNAGFGIVLGTGNDEYIITSNNTRGNYGGGILGHIAGPSKICDNNL